MTPLTIPIFEIYRDTLTQEIQVFQNEDRDKRKNLRLASEGISLIVLYEAGDIGHLTHPLGHK